MFFFTVKEAVYIISKASGKRGLGLKANLLSTSLSSVDIIVLEYPNLVLLSKLGIQTQILLFKLWEVYQILRIV
jgi:hypothetical protein